MAYNIILHIGFLFLVDCNENCIALDTWL